MKFAYQAAILALSALSAASPASDTTLPGPDSNGVYPWVSYPDANSPEGVSFRWTDGRADDTPAALTSRATTLAPRTPFKVEFHACSGARNSNGECTGACTRFEIFKNNRVNTPGTNCLSLNTRGVERKIVTCSGGCADSDPPCRHVSSGNRSQCGGNGGCYSVPGTGCVRYLK